MHTYIHTYILYKHTFMHLLPGFKIFSSSGYGAFGYREPRGGNRRMATRGPEMTDQWWHHLTHSLLLHPALLPDSWVTTCCGVDTHVGAPPIKYMAKASSCLAPHFLPHSSLRPSLDGDSGVSSALGFSDLNARRHSAPLLASSAEPRCQHTNLQDINLFSVLLIITDYLSHRWVTSPL